MGIEVHAQIKSRKKLFSGAFWLSTVKGVSDASNPESLISESGDIPNTYASPYDASFPGTLPVYHSAGQIRCIMTP